MAPSFSSTSDTLDIRTKSSTQTDNKAQTTTIIKDVRVYDCGHNSLCPLLPSTLPPIPSRVLLT